MSAHHPDGPHATARPTISPEDLAFYAEKFFPHLPLAQRLARIRELFEDALENRESRIANCK